MKIEVINPATEEVVGTYQTMNESEVEFIINKTAEQQQKWIETSFEERKKLMLKVADIFDQNTYEFATIITQEMGKPITQGIGEVKKCALLCRHYAENAERYLASQKIETENSKSYRYFRPLGTIFAIMPWNFPFWQVMRFVVPNLMGGNAAILKHAPNSTAAALAMEKAFVEAGFPKNLFSTLIIDIDLVQYVIEHKHIHGVTITGSERAGSAVASQAGKALKKVILELGGSDPYLILHDADLEAAAQQCILSRLSNAGQICISAKRIIVVEEVYDEFLTFIREQMKKFSCGDPMLAEVTMGPMAREDLRMELDGQVKASIKAGAVCEIGGNSRLGKGFYYEPTLLLNVKKGMPAYEQELFGPVVSIIKAKDEQEAIEIANDSKFGLGGAVFTQDIDRGEMIASDKIIAGMCNVNKMIASDPRIPFGGTKLSGFGRECASEGIHEFMNIKSIVVP